MNAAQQAEKVRQLQATAQRLLDSGINPALVEEGLAQEGYTMSSLNTAVSRLDALGGSQPSSPGFAGRATGSALFNFGDELAALYRNSRMSELPGLAGAFGTGVDRLFGFDAPAEKGTTYERELAAARMGMDEYARQNPGKAIAADVTGGLLPAVATMGGSLAPNVMARTPQALQAARAATQAPVASSVASNMLRGSAWGGAQGGVAGVGAGEGGASERAFSGASGAAGGVLFGAGIPGGLAAARGTKRFAEGTQAGQGMRNAASRVTGGMIRDADEYAAARARQDGLERFNRWLGEGDVSLDSLDQEVARLQSLGIDDTILADIAGPAYRSLMRGASNLSPATREGVETFLNQRAARQGERVRDVLGEATGVRPSPRIAGQTMDWNQALQQEADPLLNTIRQNGGVANVGDDPVMRDIFTRRPARQYLDRAIASSEGRADSLVGEGWQDATRVALDKTGKPVLTQEQQLLLSPGTVEEVRRFIGEDVANATGTGMGKAPAGTANTQALYGDIQRRMGELYPDYVQGLATRKAGYDFEEAAQAGREFPQMSPWDQEKLLRELAQETDAARALSPELAPNAVRPQAFREGFMSGIDERLAARENVGAAEGGLARQAVPAVSDMLTQRNLQRVFPDMGDQAQGRLGEQLAALTRQSQSRNAFLGGMNRISVLDPADPAFTAGQATSGVGGNFQPWIADRLAKSIEQGRRSREIDAIRALEADWTRAGPAAIRQFTDELAGQRVATEARGGADKALGSIAGGAAGAAAGRAVGDKDTSVGPRREDVLRGIEQRERFINDPNTTPEDRALFEQQRDRLRLLL